MKPAQPSQASFPSPSRHSSSTQSSGTTSSAGVTISAADPEAVRQQLASLLQRRSANDMQVMQCHISPHWACHTSWTGILKSHLLIDHISLTQTMIIAYCCRKGSVKRFSHCLLGVGQGYSSTEDILAVAQAAWCAVKISKQLSVRDDARVCTTGLFCKARRHCREPSAERAPTDIRATG